MCSCLAYNCIICYFSFKERTRKAAKCTKMKSAREKHASYCFSSLNMQICGKVVAVVVVVVGSLRFDDGNVNDNAKNQSFHWLNEEK